MRKISLLLWIAVWVQLTNLSRAADFSVKVADKEPPGQIGESIRKTLQPKTVQVFNGDTPVFEFWFGSEVSLKSKPGSADRKSTRLNSSHTVISYAVFCLKHKKCD